VQAELRHAQELKDAQVAAETKLDELLKEFADASAQLRKELEEESRLLKEARDRNTVLVSDQAEYDRLVIQADTLALSKSFLFSFCLQAYTFWQYVFIPVPLFFFFFPCRAFPGFPGFCAKGWESGKSSTRKEREEKRNRYKDILPESASF
jgi:hypothetical protein